MGKVLVTRELHQATRRSPARGTSKHLGTRLGRDTMQTSMLQLVEPYRSGGWGIMPKGGEGYITDTSAAKFLATMSNYSHTVSWEDGLLPATYR